MQNCKNCGQNTKNNVFCSRSCAASFNNKVVPKRATKKKCHICGNKVKSYRHNKCETHWQEYLESKPEFIRNKTLKEYFHKKSLQNLHSSSKSAHIRLLARSWFKHLTLLPCDKCGYKLHVELFHIKPISSFNENSTLGEVNSPNNIIQLCPNCHWEFDNLKKLSVP